MASLRYVGVMARAAAVFAVLFLVAQVATARAAEPCTSKVMYIAAHEDDTLLFQSPDLLKDVRSNHCVQTVFLTAGDAGKAAAYWEGREVGAEVGYAQMAGVANSWTGSQITVEGHSIHREILDGQPGISILYMRLPDGGTTGSGFPLYGEQSLRKLWNGGNAGSPSIASIEAVDDSATYTYQGLIDTLAALMDGFEPRQIATQNYLQSYPGPDHSDHVFTGYFARKAHQLYADAHRLSGYMDYETSVLPENVSGSLLAAKQQAFYEYGKHDSDACVSHATCVGTSYEKWLLRQYIAGRETTGVVANAGYAQLEQTASTAVNLDGSESSSQSGGPLQYTWTQTGGPAVALSGATTATPSFLTPSHPTLLTFSLVVRDGLTSSAPDVVRVRVPTSDPTPAAVAGADQNVSAGAAVGLDGSQSWDPNSLPLQYSWSQTGGPSVTLSGASTATPSFVAPAVPASLEFSLTVSNGTETSTPSTVTVEVKGVGPAFTSASSATFAVGVAGAFTVSASGAPAPALTQTTGSLPAGLKFTNNGNGTATISGTATSAAAATGKSQAYPLTLKADNGIGSVSQAFTLTVVNAESSANPSPPGTTPGGSSPSGGSPSGGSPPPGGGKQELQVRLSRSKVSLKTGKAVRRVVKVLPRPTKVKCVGSLPRGARCRVTARRDLVVEGSPRLMRAGTFRLWVHITQPEGSAQRQLVVQVRRPNRR